MQVFCDFDGTISVQDATDFILARFADPEWQDIEEQWKQGAIGSAECMQRQVALISASQHQLDAALDAIEIDPSFTAFADFCRSPQTSSRYTDTTAPSAIAWLCLLAKRPVNPPPVCANAAACARLPGRECI